MSLKGKVDVKCCFTLRLMFVLSHRFKRHHPPTFIRLNQWYCTLSFHSHPLGYRLSTCKYLYRRQFTHVYIGTQVCFIRESIKLKGGTHDPSYFIALPGRPSEGKDFLVVNIEMTARNEVVKHVCLGLCFTVNILF